MAALYLVSHRLALESCLEVAGSEDAVLLLGDGVYAGVRPPSARPLRALQADVLARGLGSRLGDAVEVVDDAGFVALVEAHQPVVAWR